MVRSAGAGCAAYALGCANAAYYWTRIASGVDIRETGSGAAGARNAGRLLGRKAFAGVLLLDALKGAAAVLLARSILGEVGWVEALAAVAVVAGHVWPAQLGFRGGKGVATSLGAFTAMAPWALLGITLGFAAAWLFGLRGFTRAGMVGFAAAPFALLIADGATPPFAAALAIAGIVVAAHAPNLRAGRLEGKEAAT